MMFFDEQQNLTGKPALHALVIGVSGYPNLPQTNAPPPLRKLNENPYTLGLFQLQSAALSAFKVARWLVARRKYLSVPLASVRLLMTQSALELAKGGNAFARVATSAEPPTLENVSVAAMEWRDAANSHPDGMTLLYFSGHGIQGTNGERLLLLHDFGKKGPKQSMTVTCDHLLSGMLPTRSRSHMALRQLSFFDACQHHAEELEGYEPFSPGEVWDLTDKEPKDPRNRLEFYATMPGALAYGNPGKMSYLCEALHNCFLNGGAGEIDPAYSQKPARWHVTCSSLITALQPHLEVINAREGKCQISARNWAGSDYEICKLGGPPKAEIELRINPLSAVQSTSVTLGILDQQPFLQVGPPIAPHPHRTSIPAGSYVLGATAPPPYHDSREIISVKAPFFPKPIWMQ